MPKAERGIPGLIKSNAISNNIKPEVKTEAVVTAIVINLNSFVLAYIHKRRYKPKK